MEADDLKAWRKKQGLTQDQLAMMLGVTKPCISMWEAGRRKIPAFLHLALECLEARKAGDLKTRDTKKKREVKK
jgi:DNA-binding transcriptional regulator YiaG